jgi:hypothetical protein
VARGRNAGNKGQGSKWISKTRRRKIYDRDGWKCVWCNSMVGIDTYTIDEWHGDQHVVTEVKLATLDHVVARSAGGSNATNNLITCCMRCNRWRGAIGWFEYTRFVVYRMTEDDPPNATRLRRLAAPIRKRIRTILNTNWGF